MPRHLAAVTIFSFCLALIGSLASADSNDDFERIRDDVWRELHFRFEAGDARGIQERRERLRILFSNVPPEFAREFRNELGTVNSGGEFSQAFHGRLATAVHNQMLEILLFVEGSADSFDDRRASPAEIFGQADNDIGQQHLFDRIDRAIVDLDPVRRERLACMTSLLREPTVDDQVIQWGRICRPVNLTPCDATISRVSQSELHRLVTSEAAVVSADRSLNFITNLRSLFERHANFASDDFFADNIVFVTDQVVRTNVFIEQMTAPALGGGSAAPRAYRHIKSWLRSQQANRNSVLSCFRN